MALEQLGSVAELVSRALSAVAHRVDLDESMQTLSEQVRELFGADDVGLLIGDATEAQAVYVTSDQAGTAEALQLRAGEGPCLESFRTKEVTLVRNGADAEARWPLWALSREHDAYESYLAVPLRHDGTVLGTLNLLATDTDTFDDEAAEAAARMADLISLLLMVDRRLTESERRAAQLQYALDSRVLIEQAKGVLAERLGIGVDQAFERLRRSARSDQRLLVDVCREVVAGHATAS